MRIGFGGGLDEADADFVDDGPDDAAPVVPVPGAAELAVAGAPERDVEGGAVPLPKPFVVEAHALSAPARAAAPTSAASLMRTCTGTACQAGGVVAQDGARSARVDALDARLLRELDGAPRVGVLELSRRLGVARGTVQARLDRLVERGVIASFAPVLDPEALGYAVTAFATLEIRQGRGKQVLEHLRGIPQVLEVHTITGQGDMLCRVVARSNDDLQQVLDAVTQFPEIVRTSTVIALSNPVQYRVLPLV